MTKIATKISLIILIGIIYTACNSVKKVPENKHLLTKNEIIADGKHLYDESVTNLLYQTPNSSIPLINYRFRLSLYNLSKKNQDSSYKAQFINNPAKYRRQVRLLSAKQVKRKGESFFYAGIDNLLKKTGEPPVIIDIKKTEKTLTRLKSYFFNQGYYNAAASFKIDTLDKKKAKITYNITKGPASFLDTITAIIDSPELDTLYNKTKKRSFLKKGKQFNNEDFIAERERLTSYFQNHGVYNFQQSNITYDIDTIKTGNKSNIDVLISDFSYRKGDSTLTKPFKKYTISEVNIYTDKMTGKSRSAITDSVTYDNINLFSISKLKYKPKALTDAIFISKGSLYSIDNTTLTSRYLANLKNFNYPSIQYEIDKRDTIHNYLISNIYLTPLEKRHFSTALDLTHSNIQEFGILGTAGILVRNIFKGIETFEINGRANVGASKTSANPNNSFFNVSEYGIDTRLSFPRVVFPGNTDKIIPRRMMPVTGLSLGFSKQNNIGLDKESFISAVRYDWKPKTNVTSRFDLLNIQYVNNLNISNYYHVYQSSYNELNGIALKPEYPVNQTYFDDKHNLIIESGTKGFTNDVLTKTLPTTTEDFNSVRSLEEKRIRLTENNLIFSTSYSYSKTTKKDIQDNSFYAFRTKFESAGNFLSLVARLSKQLNEQERNNTVFGVIYSQYFKSEFEYIKHFNLTHKRTLALRSFVGLAIPYGNSDNVPFSRSYFAGGSNDIRAWQPYSLGPGSTGAINDFNEANMKITLNAEYRFNIYNSLNGALFIDGGNIWNTLDNITDPKAIFSGVKSLQNMAIGTGFGVRYDLEIFVVRFDLGLKTYDPSLESGQKWFTKFNLNNSVLNFGINYPF